MWRLKVSGSPTSSSRTPTLMKRWWLMRASGPLCQSQDKEALSGVDLTWLMRFVCNEWRKWWLHDFADWDIPRGGEHGDTEPDPQQDVPLHLPSSLLSFWHTGYTTHINCIFISVYDSIMSDLPGEAAAGEVCPAQCGAGAGHHPAALQHRAHAVLHQDLEPRLSSHRLEIAF